MEVEGMRRRTESPRRTRILSLTVALVAALVAFVGPPAAQAGPLVASAGDCATAQLEQPFQPWLDPASYVLMPNGGVENGGPPLAPHRWSGGARERAHHPAWAGGAPPL